MPTTVATEAQMHTAEEQLENARMVLKYWEAHHKGPVNRWDYFTEDARIYFPTRDDYPIPEKAGPAKEIFKQIGEEYANRGFKYDVEVHSVYTCGPLVILHRTDIRKVEGQPDKPVPAVGVFVVKNGKIVGWSDYYR